MRDKFRRILRFAVVYPLLAVSPSLIAQTAETGTLAGTVSDGSGHFVVNATVTVTSQDTGQLRNRATGTVGTYRFEQLPEGIYSVRFKSAAPKVVMEGREARISGTIPAKLSDFKIEPPTLLTLPVKNEIPVRFEMTWGQQGPGDPEGSASQP